MRAIAKVGIVLVLVTIVASVTVLIATSSRPVLYSFSEEGDPVKEPFVAIFNLFRDKSPERAAEALLNDLKHAKYNTVLALVDDPDMKALITMFQRCGRLHSWGMRNRQDSERTSRLFYWITWGESGSWDDGPLWVIVHHDDKQDAWKVVECKSW